jgi:hypothetical protein
MLCDVCKSIDFVDLCFRASQSDQPSFGESDYVPIKVPHHTTFSGLKAAAEKGCELCVEILKDGTCWGHLSQYDSPKSAIHFSLSGIAFHKSSKPYDGQTYRGVSSLSFTTKGFPFWSSVRVFCDHGMETHFYSYVCLISNLSFECSQS